MKYLFYTIILCISGTQSSYSIEFLRDSEKIGDFYEVYNDEEYITYEFGLTKLNSVYLVKDDAHIDVYISDGNNIIFSTTCKMSPILDWAFENASKELATAQYVTNNEYKPMYYKLTVMVDRVQTIIESSSMQIAGMPSVVDKINELKSFIIGLWADSLEIQNNREH